MVAVETVVVGMVGIAGAETGIVVVDTVGTAEIVETVVDMAHQQKMKNDSRVQMEVENEDLK